MSESRLLRAGPVVVLVALALMLAPVPAGSPSAVAQELEDYPQVDEDELPARYQRWLDEVHWIITETERDVFLRLQSDEQRDLFIEEFWKNRDPTPGTPENEYYDLHYERFEYANEFFGRGVSVEGWRTDRGKIWILFGEPVSRNRYQNPMTTYPAEVWFYANEPELGMPPFHYIVFYQRHNTGDYRLYSPVSDGPERLLNPTGIQYVRELRDQEQRRPLRGFSPTGFGDLSAVHQALMEIDVDLANAAFSLYPAEGGLEFGISPLQSEMLLAKIEQVPDRIMPDKTWAYDVLTGVTSSEVRYETLVLDAQAVPMIARDGQPFIHFAATTPGDSLHMGDYEGEYYFTFEASGSLTADGMKVLHSFQDALSADIDEETARRLRDSSFIYMDQFPVTPGSQEFELTLENTVSNQFGRVGFDLDVPEVFPEEIDVAGPFLAVAVQRAANYDPFGEHYPFQHGDTAMIPAVDERVPLGNDLVVFEQVLTPRDFDGAVTVRAELRDADGSVVRDARRSLPASQADEHGVIPAMLTIGTDDLAEGQYTLEVVTDGVDGPPWRRQVELFALEGDAPSPFVNAQPAAPPTDPAFAAMRAKQYRVRGDMDRAIEWIDRAVESAPDNEEYREQLVELLTAAGSHRQLVEVLTPVAARSPNDADVLIRLGHAHAALGEHYDAIRYFERARLAGSGDDPEILNTLASEYHAEGDAEKARELLQRSLEVDPEQPEVQRMLDRLSTATDPEA